MPDSMPISDLTTAEQVSGSDLFETAIPNAMTESGYVSRKVTANALALLFNNTLQFSSQLQTTAKTLIGAINEVAQGGGGGGASVDMGTTDPSASSGDNGDLYIKYDGTTYEVLAMFVKINNAWQTIETGNAFVELTQVEYDALTSAEKNSDTPYLITDANGDGSQFQPIVYSETEREVGVWIDGKPLYERTFDLTSVTLTDATWTNSILGTGSSGIEIKEFKGKFTLDGSLFADYIYYRASSEYFTAVLNSSEDDINVRPNIGGGYTLTAGYCTIRYTKTADAAGSGIWTPQGVPSEHYSTDEQVVGTWIDGSTIYEKTISCGALPSSQNKLIAHNISNIGEVVAVSGTSINTSTGVILYLPYVNVGSDRIGICVTDTDIELSASTNLSAYTTTYVTLRYTKTA